MISRLKVSIRLAFVSTVAAWIVASPAHADLVGRYNFEEGVRPATPGASVLDTGATPAADGTFAGTAASYVAGKIGTSALDFTGTATNHVTLGNPAKYSITGALTLSAWIFRDNAGRIVSKQGGNGQRGWTLQIEGTAGTANITGGNNITSFAAGGAVFQIAPTGTQVYGVGTLEAMPTDRWVLLTGVFDPTGQGTATPTMYIYVDGQLNRSLAVASATQFNSTNNVYIGARPVSAAGDIPFDGRIDDVRIYDEALSASQVAALVPEPGMVAGGVVAIIAILGSRRRRQSV